LVSTGHKNLKSSDLLFVDDLITLPIINRLAACGDAAELMDTAESLGLDLSERTAHRVLSGEIKPVKPLLQKILPSANNEPKKVNIKKDTRGLKLAKEDIEAFARSLERAFEPIANSYYLQLKDMPKITVKGDTITAKFPIEKDL
jgi:hypothetical protein